MASISSISRPNRAIALMVLVFSNHPRRFSFCNNLNNTQNCLSVICRILKLKRSLCLFMLLRSRSSTQVTSCPTNEHSVMLEIYYERTQCWIHWQERHWFQISIPEDSRGYGK